MGLRFIDEPTAVHEFEKMTDEEMDEIFYTDDEIGEFRHSAFMIECGLEEENWDIPDVEPLPWPKEVDEMKIEKFESNLAVLKAKRKQQMAEIEANGYSPSNVSPPNTDRLVQPEANPLKDEPKPVQIKVEKIKADDSKSSIELQPASSRTATNVESTSSTNDALGTPASATSPNIPPKSPPKSNKSITTKAKVSPKRVSPKRVSPKQKLMSPRRSYSMDIRSQDKKKLDNILKAIESPETSPKKEPASISSTKTKPKENKEPEEKAVISSKADREVKSKPTNTLAGDRYTAPLSGGGSNKTKWMPVRGIPRANSLKKGSKKNRNKILASLDASLDDETDDIIPKITNLKRTMSADLEHLDKTTEGDDTDQGERRRSLMRTNSGNVSKVKRKPRRRKKKKEENGKESPTKSGSKKKKLSKQSSQRGLGGDNTASDAKPSKRSSLKKQSSLRRSQSLKNLGSDNAGSDMKPKKRSSLKRAESMKIGGDSSKKNKRPPLKRSESGSSTGSGKAKKRSSLKRQASLKLSERSTGSDVQERKPRRGMKKQESLRLKKLENSMSEISVDMSKVEDDDKSRKKSKDKGKRRALAREEDDDNSESSLSEDELKDPKLLSPIREPTRKRGKSIDRSTRSTHSRDMSSVSSGVSFLDSIDSLSDGSDQTIETVDDDELFDIPDRPTAGDETDDESDHEMKQEFYRYMKAQPTRRLAGVKVYTVYHEQKSSNNGKMVANRNYVCAALVLGARS